MAGHGLAGVEAGQTKTADCTSALGPLGGGFTFHLQKPTSHVLSPLRAVVGQSGHSSLHPGKADSYLNSRLESKWILRFDQTFRLHFCFTPNMKHTQDLPVQDSMSMKTALMRFCKALPFPLSMSQVLNAWHMYLQHSFCWQLNRLGEFSKEKAS